MNRNEVIVALEVCVSHDCCPFSEECPYEKYGDDCLMHLIPDAKQQIVDLLRENSDLQDKLNGYTWLESMRKQREFTSGWVEYWRKKTGRGKDWFPDWDEIFKDWSETRAENEKLNKTLAHERDMRDEGVDEVLAVLDGLWNDHETGISLGEYLKLKEAIGCLASKPAPEPEPRKRCREMGQISSEGDGYEEDALMDLRNWI